MHKIINGFKVEQDFYFPTVRVIRMNEGGYSTQTKEWKALL